VAEAPILGDMHEEVGIDSRVVRTESESATAVLVKCRLGYAGELRDYRARIEQAISLTTLVARFLHRTFRDVAMGLLVAREPQFVRERSADARNVGGRIRRCWSIGKDRLGNHIMRGLSTEIGPIYSLRC
jgi:hypothetical protein